MRSRIFIALLALAGLMVASTAEAAFKLRITVDATVVTVTDDGLGDNLPGTPGAISFAGSVNGVLITTYAATSKPVRTNPSPAMASSWTMENLSGSAKSIMLEYTDTDFGLPIFAPAVGFLHNSTHNPAGSGSGDYTAYADAGNAEFAQTTATETLTLTGNDSKTSKLQSLPGLINYSLTGLFHQQTLANNASLQGSLDIFVVIPEPSTMLLAGLGLPGIAFLRRRAKAKAKAAAEEAAA